MRTVFGLLSLDSFALVLFIALMLVSSPPAQMLMPVLALALCFGATVFFRGLRARMT
jgi:hypothetical protein